MKFSKEKENVVKRPIGINIVGVLNLLGILNLLYIFANRPILIMGVFLSENIAKIYYVVTAILGVYLGIGFLKRIKHTWYIWMAEGILFLVSGMLNLFCTIEIENRAYKVGNFIGIVFIVCIMFYVYSERYQFGIGKQE